tara:strand:- start:4194 stop:4334 length:141 start_codon:yes stop_codon:yes gene_type:complete
MPESETKTTRECRACYGTGKYIDSNEKEEKCEACEGAGVFEVEKND